MSGSIRVSTFVAAGLALSCSVAQADQAATSPSALPILALAPYGETFPPPSTPPSPWSGLTVGSEVFGVSGSGRDHGGGIGGAATLGYQHEFANNLVLGVEGAVGYTPSIFSSSRYTGFDTAAANFKLGYDMGRLMPYVTVGGVLAKPHLTALGTGYTGASDAVNGLFSGSTELKGAGSVGAGFDYAVTDHLTVGFSASVLKGSPGFVQP